jgi:hypothetical protein
MKIPRASAIAKEIGAAAGGKLALAFDDGLTPVQRKLWADALGLRPRDSWTEGDRPMLRAYVDAWAAYNAEQVIKTKRQYFAHIRELATALGIYTKTREQNTSGVTRKAIGARAKQVKRAAETLSSSANGDRLLAIPLN